MISMDKPTYYLWKNDYSTQEEYEAAKERYLSIGFRVVTFRDGPKEEEIHTGLKMLIKNHIGDYHN